MSSLVIVPVPEFSKHRTVFEAENSSNSSQIGTLAFAIAATFPHAAFVVAKD